MMISVSSRSRSGNNNNSRVRANGGLAPFLMKTHEMVDDEGTKEVISWGENGTTFVVWKPVEFARDLLPVHFKHCNFSSFVRQLNTYGFRKVVPDRWEFANDNFRRGDRALLCKIRRRKASLNPSTTNKLLNDDDKVKNTNTATPTSTSTSLDIHSSSSTSSPPPPRPPLPSQHFIELSNENEKLKKDNQILNNELIQAKQHCERLLSSLSNYVDMNDMNTSLLLKEAASVGVGIEQGKTNKIEEEKATGEDVEANNVACLKLFGVLLKAGSGAPKRGRCEEGSNSGRPAKVCGGGAPWMAMASPVSN
ncbi:heat stress transcription factor B-1-like [Asparagus officinalis]|uniref:heat stress transcription factor B-1-like n=1 Tax=Asparagus officinalis TaxID=4686 RepID=UPI00098E409D|nr:heat stress transcription factor B-1-like [Asparagus officinalis]